jgi:hypothetical protein
VDIDEIVGVAHQHAEQFVRDLRGHVSVRVPRKGNPGVCGAI